MDYQPLPIIANEFVGVVVPLIDSARHSIDVVVFDWRFYKNDPSCAVSQFNLAVARAVRRGVNVRCLVQSDAVVASLKVLGCNARRLHSKNILHTKLLILDKKSVIIGSHNYTQRAFTSNHEASIYVEMASADNQLVQYFNNLFGI